MVFSAGFGFGTGDNLLASWLANPVGSQSTANPLGPFSSFGGQTTGGQTTAPDTGISGLVSNFLLNPVGAGGSAAAATQTSMYLGVPDTTGLSSQTSLLQGAQSSAASTPVAGFDFLSFINGGSTGGIGTQTGATSAAPDFMSGLSTTGSSSNLTSIGEILGKDFDLGNLNFGIYNSLSSTAGRYDRLGGLSGGIQNVMQGLNSDQSIANLLSSLKV